MKHQFLFILMSSTILVHPAFSKTTLKQALESAYTTPQIQAKREEALSRHENHVQAKSGFLPKVTVGASRSKNHGVESNDSSNETNRSTSMSFTNQGYVSIKQNIFKGFSTLSSMDKVNADVYRAWAELELEEQKIMKEAVDAYL
ncbi:MAG: TolC family protein, partial [Alphaproteobacteria bacterium]|nr:TolC family protein [Alphaproteobacteria bacterium]